MALSPHLRQPLWTSFSFTAAKSTATPGSLYEVIPKFEAGNQHDIMSIGFSSALIRHRPKIIFPLKYRFRAPPGYLSLNIEEGRKEPDHPSRVPTFGFCPIIMGRSQPKVDISIVFRHRPFH